MEEINNETYDKKNILNSILKLHYFVWSHAIIIDICNFNTI